MLDYALFHKEVVDEFCQFLKENGIDARSSAEDDCFQVSIPEDVDDALCDRIESKYDELLSRDRSLLMGEDGDEAEMTDLATVVLNLKDGSVSNAFVAPGVLFRILDAVSPAEFEDFVAALVAAVETPERRTICEVMRERREHNGTAAK